MDVKEFITKKEGPLPRWAWVGLGAGAWLLYKHFKGSTTPQNNIVSPQPVYSSGGGTTNTGTGSTGTGTPTGGPLICAANQAPDPSGLFCIPTAPPDLCFMVCPDGTPGNPLNPAGCCAGHTQQQQQQQQTPVTTGPYGGPPSNGCPSPSTWDAASGTCCPPGTVGTTNMFGSGARGCVPIGFGTGPSNGTSVGYAPTGVGNQGFTPQPSPVGNTNTLGCPAPGPGPGVLYVPGKGWWRFSGC